MGSALKNFFWTKNTQIFYIVIGAVSFAFLFSVGVAFVISMAVPLGVGDLCAGLFLGSFAVGLTASIIRFFDS